MIPCARAVVRCWVEVDVEVDVEVEQHVRLGHECDMFRRQALPLYCIRRAASALSALPALIVESGEYARNARECWRKSEK